MQTIAICESFAFVFCVDENAYVSMQKCGRKIDADYATCDCKHPHNCPEQKKPICCGHEMLEMMDDQSILPFLHCEAFATFAQHRCMVETTPERDKLWRMNLLCSQLAREVRISLK